MKLLSFLNSLIVEAVKRDKFITAVEDNNNDEIVLVSSYHQNIERYGFYTFEEIIDLYDNSKGKIRFGVPNDMIKDIFIKRLQTIIDSYSRLSKGENRIIFVKKRNTEPELLEKFDYIEFILQKNNNKFTIITSAFSEDGNFLRSSHIPKTHKVFVENKEMYNYQIIIL